VLKGSSSTLAPLGDVRAGFSLMSGRPSVASQRSMYWRKRDVTPGFQTPEQDDCGVLWVCPLVPLEGRQAAEANALVERIILDHGLEPLVGWIVQQERVAYFIVLLIYDRAVPGEEERAMACHDAVMTACIARGWIPWRLGIHSMGALAAGRDDSDDVLRDLKRALDPRDLLAPGRYSPR
jgi:4-cresol dehydrogenase (hydroxylating)